MSKPWRFWTSLALSFWRLGTVFTAREAKRKSKAICGSIGLFSPYGVGAQQRPDLLGADWWTPAGESVNIVDRNWRRVFGVGPGLFPSSLSMGFVFCPGDRIWCCSKGRQRETTNCSRIWRQTRRRSHRISVMHFPGEREPRICRAFGFRASPEATCNRTVSEACAGESVLMKAVASSNLPYLEGAHRLL